MCRLNQDIKVWNNLLLIVLCNFGILVNQLTNGIHYIKSRMFYNNSSIFIWQSFLLHQGHMICKAFPVSVYLFIIKWRKSCCFCFWEFVMMQRYLKFSSVSFVMLGYIYPIFFIPADYGSSSKSIHLYHFSYWFES